MEYLPLCTPEQARRHEVRPGITGRAQVNGRNAIGRDEKFRLDVWYVDHRSIGLDLRILGLTVLKVLAAGVISARGEATMPKFRGTSARDPSSTPAPIGPGRPTVPDRPRPRPRTLDARSQ